MKRSPYVLIPAALLALSACASKPSDTVTLDQDKTQSCAPLVLQKGQTLILTLPSNPTTGFRWTLSEDASPQLRNLGPEVYTNPEEEGLIGAEGTSTWRFRAAEVGRAHLKLAYQRPWETAEPASQSVDCALEVR
ncbi:protease inhibitor I42 family protein [Pseudomonas matsuisoli]|uniref:Inhibitor of cysteine peptidase n=1 Tax=Pseudomonas matsuisoli TaxID=1515666 RepID=A0A917PIM2_9PSED|nr:protease inhibitor I42 family protein [Pseudomonas matsuisoli]GGJ79710.1 inhibitor of cysteine peptidase [Pseudomonas matsuisoli]